jgi:hypothetical protein
MMVQRYPGAPVAASFQAMTYQSITELQADRATRGSGRMGAGMPPASRPAAKPAGSE